MSRFPLETLSYTWSKNTFHSSSGNFFQSSSQISILLEILVDKYESIFKILGSTPTPYKAKDSLDAVYITLVHQQGKSIE